MFPTRILAVQILYALEMCQGNKSLDLIKQGFIQYHEEKFGDSPLDYKILSSIVTNVNRDKIDIDNNISTLLSDTWSVDRLPIVVLCIFRASYCENIFSDANNRAELICDYLQVAKSLNYTEDIKFINAIIDSITKKIPE